MSTHNHKHDHCKHDRMKYCGHCDRPYCLDCGHEWNQYQTWVYPNVYSNQITRYTTSNGTNYSGGLGMLQSDQNTAGALGNAGIASVATTSTTCRHQESTH